MKRLLSVICICALLLSLGLPCGAETVDYEYSIVNGEVTITSWSSFAIGCAKVPAFIEGCPVTAIGPMSFSNCTDLTEIQLPDSIRSIGYGAFWGCSSLQYIVLPDSLTSIGSSAFSYCESLLEIHIPEGVTVLEESLFLLCENLQTVTIPESVTVIEPFAFNQCSSLMAVEIPSGVSVISQAAFAFCTSMTQVTLPDSLSVIGDYAFYGCQRLKRVAAPEVFGFIEYLEIFEGYNLSMLQGVVMPSALTSIGMGAFGYCNELWYMVFPGDVVDFGELCFEGIYPTIYYHAGNPTWTDAVMQDYGGAPLWFGIHAFMDYVPDGNATCTTDGTKTSKCLLCDATDTVADVGSKGHRYEDGVCGVCGDTEYGVIGDVNGDGKVNMKDWNRLYDHINENNLLSGNAWKRADVNGDGKVNMKDWNRLYDHISEVNPLW